MLLLATFTSKEGQIIKIMRTAYLPASSYRWNPKRKKAIGTKWVYRNKKDERGIVVWNKTRLVAQGHRQEEGIDYNEVFAPVARIKAIMIFLDFASFIGFIVYQMDVKSAFLYGTIEEESGEGIFISQDKYVAEILKKFDFSSVKTASTPIETQKPLVKDEEATDVDVHLYRSMIRSLMYLTASRPDIMFAVYACLRLEVTLKLSHLHAVKRIFRYLKGQPKLGLWYPRNSPFDLEAYSDSDYAGANLDRKFTTEGCQFIGMRLISWQCKKQTIVATSTTEAEYVAAANCYGQFWNTAASKTVNSVNQIHAIIDGKAVVISESSVRSDLLFNDEDDAQTRFETASKKSHDPPLLEVNTSGSVEDIMEHPDDLMDIVPPKPYDSPLSGGHTPRSDEDRPNLLELINTCTQLSNRVLALEEAQTTQDKVITKLKLRVRRLEKKRKARTSQPMKRRLFKGRVETPTDKSFEDKGSGEKGGSTADQVSTARPEVCTTSVPVNVSVATPSTPPTTTTIFDVEELPRLTRSTTTLQPLPTIDPKDKGKGVLVEKKPKKIEKVKRRDQGLAQIESDAYLAQRICEEELAELDRAQKEKQKQEEATIAALTEEFDEIQAKIDANHELAVRMTHEEKEKGTSEAILKGAKWINDFVPMDSEKEEKKSVGPESKGKKGKRIKRVADSALKQKSSKKPKMMQEQKSAKSDVEESADYIHENEELRMWLTVVSDKEKTVDPEILSTKEKVSSHQGNAREDVALEAEAESTMAFELLKFIKS
nr:ribonuclease H-like domain, reverse transcriptase, RNA-dependent DNA polymerase [Tanacetum cinerariifolium]